MLIAPRRRRPHFDLDLDVDLDVDLDLDLDLENGPSFRTAPTMSIFTIARIAIPLIIIGGSVGVTGIFLRRGFPRAWQRWLGRASRWALSGLAGAFAVWWVARIMAPQTFLPDALQVLVVMGMVSALTMALTGVIWGPVAVYSAPTDRPADPRRRAFMRVVGASMPAAATVVGPGGTIAAVVRPVLTRLTVRSENVDDGLDGFTILQLTDVHLGAFIHEGQFQAVVDAVTAAGVTPDLVVLTGDIADDFAQLPGALRRLAALKARHGITAIIGNHEIYRGRATAERIYAEEGVRFLCNGGDVVEHNGSRLWLAGADDPARGLDGPAHFLQRTVDRAFRECPDDIACRVLLTHRPRGFEHALPHGVTLALAGHTHGGQVALFGRSLFEAIWPESFMLGRYVRPGARGPATLYTSAGLGHWMPFRLNCPCEAALVTLRTATAAPSAKSA